ncbi:MULTISPECIES: hypothetical protein [Cyanophyceae]|uniref:hypothetical protein n=1 Tax=Cyanophyceae TaxID=3028117 RepID=UPI001683DD2D|nr:MULTISPECIES: hypothetical protein [Cyanophyceae]MBD1917166.1 hypothetical protein [Phormidium sp. FACHB-77]MBD2030697.1 hypothetical protein [Phormidium sp. FACHB-322]MBD2050195.1 hypothetical protein [Leptolyngbya sp. FACHB-60]
MATVLPGTGGTIKSTTAEGQAHEILTFIGIRQQSLSTNPGEVTNVSGQHDQQALIFSGTYEFTVAQTISNTGGLTLEATPYLVGTGFQVGTGGTFKGNSPEKYALEVLMYLQSLELQPAKNPQNRNFITGTFNSDTGRYQGSFSIPVILGIDAVSGVVNYGANPYLL